MPVLLTGWKPDDITGPDFLNWAALALRPTAAVRDNQRLTERMLVPGGARTWFKRDAGSCNTCRIGGLLQRVNANRTGEVLRRSLAGGL